MKYFTEGRNFLITVTDQIYEVKTILNWCFHINLQTFINLKFYPKFNLATFNSLYNCTKSYKYLF